MASSSVLCRFQNIVFVQKNSLLYTESKYAIQRVQYFLEIICYSLKIFNFFTSFKTARVISSALTVVYDVLRRMVGRGLNVREEFGGARCYFSERTMN